LLPALSLQGVEYAKIIEGSYTTELFIDFLQGFLAQMNPFSTEKSLIVMNNARIHHNAWIREMIEE
ncbi:hypothetical protein BGY98DRAFT_884279, partial [Russula aff. rugulosa BPL654]